MDNQVREAPKSIEFAHSPARATTLALKAFKARQTAPFRLSWGVKTWDEYLIPMMAGDLTSLVARPGHAKTSILIHLSQLGSTACNALAAMGENNYMVVYATWETTVEEFVGLLTVRDSGQSLESIARGQADLIKVQDAAVAAIANNVWVFGRSERVKTRTPFSLLALDSALSYLQEIEGMRPVIILLDYLQRIPALVRGQEMQKRVMENTEFAKDLGMIHGCPTVMGVQAKRDVDLKSGLKMPALDSAQWASTIEQTSDKVLGLSRPCLYMDDESTITQSKTGQVIPVTPTLLAMRVLKHRWGRAGRTFYAHFDPEKITLGDLALDEEPLKQTGF